MGAAKLKDAHRLDLAGSFSFGNSLLQTADHYSLRVEHISNDTYRIAAVKGPLNIDKITPAYIPHNGDHFQRAQVEQLLKFLHQPARVLSAANSDKNTAQEQRRTIHELLRFATTGSAEIKESPKAAASGPSCHADAEERMKQQDMWRSEIEFGNARDIEAAIPHTGFDPQKGFSITLDEKTLGGPLNTESAILRDEFWKLVDETKPKQRGARPQTLHFTATELENFVRAAHQNPALKSILEASQVEQQARHILAEIKSEPAAIDTQQELEAIEEQINLVLQSTSALTPVITSEHAEQAWKKFKISKASYSPFPDIAREMATMNKALEDVPAGQYKATVSQFASLITFMHKAANDMGLNKIESALSEGELQNILLSERFMAPHHREALDVMRKALEKNDAHFTNAMSAAGGSIAKVAMETYSFATETRMRTRIMALGTVAWLSISSLVANPAFMQNMRDVTGMQQQPKAESAVFFGADGQMDEIKIDSPPAGAAAPLPPGLESAQAAPPPPELTPTSSCPMPHIHPAINKAAVIHCGFNDVIKKFVSGTNDAIDKNSDMVFSNLGVIESETATFSNFSKASRAAINPTANFWFWANMMQLMAHLPFFGMMLMRGNRQGFNAIKETRGLMGDFADNGMALLRYRPLVLPATILAGAYAATNNWHVTGTILAAAAAGAAGNYIWKRTPGLRGKILDDVTDIQFLTDAAKARVGAETILPEERLEAQNFKLKIAGIKQTFKLHAENIPALQDALAKFDTLVTNAAGQIGVAQPWYEKLLKEKITTATQALENYKADADVKKLQTAIDQSLKDLVGAQARHFSETSLYSAAFGEQATPDVESKLRRHGNVVFSANSRGERINRHWKNILSSDEKNLALRYEDKLKSGIAIGANAIWAGMVRSARAAQYVYDAVPHKKPLAIAFSTVAAAAITLDLSDQAEILLGNDWGKISDAFSGLLGTAYGTGTTTTTFGLYNLYDDTVLTDTIGGLMAMGAGIGLWSLRKSGKFVNDSTQAVLRSFEKRPLSDSTSPSRAL